MGREQSTGGRELPILMSGRLVVQTMAGQKTHTRRVTTRSTSTVDGPNGWGADLWSELDFANAWVDPGPSPAGNPGPYLKVPRPSTETVHRVYPRIQAGDLLWVRETFALTNVGAPDSYPIVHHRADMSARFVDGRGGMSAPETSQHSGPWKPSITHVDEDGYPTHEGFEALRTFKVLGHADGLRARCEQLLALAKRMWWHDWFEREGDEYRVSTGGWSGNEMVVEALRRNGVFWILCWEEHRRGGHYVFRLPRDGKDGAS